MQQEDAKKPNPTAVSVLWFFMLLDGFCWLGLFSVYAGTYGFHPSHDVLRHKYPTHLKSR